MSGQASALAPCPFCGHDDIRRDNPANPDNNGIVYCDQCGVEALSADAWNMRTTSAAVAELIADTARALDAWDTTTIHRAQDGMLQERMECLRQDIVRVGGAA